MAMDREQLKEVFARRGFGKNGFISLDELSELCDYFGMDKMTTADLKQLYRNLDTDGDGKVSNKEFMVGIFRKDSLNYTTVESTPIAFDKNQENISSDTKTKNDKTPVKSIMSNMFTEFMNQNQLGTRSDASEWLNYLDAEGIGHTKGDDIIKFWEHIGIPGGRDILKMLELDPNSQMQPSDLSHALERELQKNENPLLHKVAIHTLLHSTDKYWNDNLYLVEEYQKIKGNMEKLKKDAENDIKELTQKMDMEIGLLQEANRKLREEPPKDISITSTTNHDSQEIPDDLHKTHEDLERQLEKSMEECKKLKQRNFYLESEIEKLRLDLESADTEVSNLCKENEQLTKQLKEVNFSSDRQLNTFPSASFDIDDSMTHEEIREKIKIELDKVQRSASAERKNAEGMLLVEISDLEKKYEEKLENVKANYEGEKADIISAHKRELEDALASKEKELMTDFVKNEVKYLPNDILSEPKEKKLNFEESLEQKEKEIKRLNDELSEKSKQLEKLSSSTISLMKDAAIETDPIEMNENVCIKNDLEDSLSPEKNTVPMTDISSTIPSSEKGTQVMVEASIETKPQKSIMGDALSSGNVIHELVPSDFHALQKENYEKKLEDVMSDLEEVKYKNKELKEENEKLRLDHAKEVEELKSLHVNDLKRISFHEEEMKVLSVKHENDISTLKRNHENELMSLHEEHELTETSTKQKLEDANKRVARLTDELSKMDAMIEALEEKMNECDKKITCQELELSSKDKDLEVKNKEALAKDKKIADLEKQLKEHFEIHKNCEFPVKKEGLDQDTERDITNLKNDYEFVIAQLKKTHEAELEKLRNDPQLQQTINPISRRLTMPVNETRPKLTDLIKNYESRFSDASRVDYKKSLNKNGDVLEKNSGMLSSDHDVIVMDLKKQFDEEKLELNQKYNYDLKKEQDTINHLQKTINEMKDEKKSLLQTINEYEERIAKILGEPKKEREVLEGKPKSYMEAFSDEIPRQLSESLSSLPEHMEPLSDENLKESKKVFSVIEEYKKKLDDLKTQMKKEKEDQKEAYEEELKRVKNDFQTTQAHPSQDVYNKSVQTEVATDSVSDGKLENIVNDFEQQIHALKMENDQEVCKHRQLFEERDEELRKNYEDLMNDLKQRKEKEILSLDNTIKNLRKDLSNMRNSQKISTKVHGFEHFLKKQIDELSKENTSLREENLQLQTDLNSLNVKTDDFQKLMLHIADLNAEKDMTKDQLKRTLEQLNKVTSVLTAATSQHRADKESWTSLKEKLVDPIKLRESINKATILEAENRKLRNILERNQLETAQILISTRESQDKEMKELFTKLDATNELTQKLRRVLDEKDKMLLQIDEKRIKSDHLAKDLYLENAKLIKCLQQLEKQNLETNSRIQVLEQKCATLGDLVRKLCPAAIG